MCQTVATLGIGAGLLSYYGRKKCPDPPIINTDNTHMSCRNFHIPSTGTVCGICTVLFIEWHDYWHINKNLWMFITNYFKFTR